MRRSVPSLLLVGLVGCNAIAYPTSPVITSTPAAGIPTRLTLVVSPTELPLGGGTAFVFVETSIDGQRAAPRVRVALTASEGTLETAAVTTDDTGHARLSWSGAQAATLLASAGDLQTSAQVRIAQPVALPPPSTPPAPLPPLPPDPAPTPPPDTPAALAASLVANPPTTRVGIDTTLLATVHAATLQPGEAVLAYQWDFKNDGALASTATTTTPARAFSYNQHGVYTAKVTVVTSLGRRASATTTVAVTN